MHKYQYKIFKQYNDTSFLFIQFYFNLAYSKIHQLNKKLYVKYANKTVLKVVTNLIY